MGEAEVSRAPSAALAAAAVGCVLVAVLAGPAAAAARAPTVAGSITGVGKQGRVLVFRVQATDRTGFGHLDTLRVALQLHSVILDEITYDRTRNTVETTSSVPVAVGTGGEVIGSFLAVDARSLDIRSRGNAVALTMRARVLQDIPAGSTFSLGAGDDANLVAWVARPVRLPEAARSGFTWSDLLVAVAAALFVGGFVGNLVAGRRGDGGSPVDVYDMITSELRRQPLKS